MKKFISLVFLGVMLSGCSLAAQPASMEETPVKIYTGTLSGRGGLMYLQTVDGKTVQVTSKKVDLENVQGKEVTVEGQFSGTTLYVDKLQ